MATMDVKQLMETSKQLLKALEGGDSPTTILSLLKPLESFTATESLLRQSKIGVSVSKLRQSKDSKVQELSSRLINKWKADVKKKQAESSSPKPPPVKANGANSSSGATSSPAPGPIKTETKSIRKSKVAPEKRTAEADEINWKITGNDTRDSCLKLIYNGLTFMSEEGPDEILTVAQSVELAAYNQYKPETSTEYKAKIRSLFMNLKMKENANLRREVFTGEIEPKRFVTMSSEELRSAEKRELDAALEKENMSKAMTAREEKAISTTFTCGKCKQNRVAYSQAQTRSADEPMTTFCECVNCGNRWKFS